MSGLLESLKSMYAHNAIVSAGIENGSVRGIPLTRGMAALVDADDYGRLAKYNWQAYRGNRHIYYAQRHIMINGKKSSSQMHREILNIHVGDKHIIDHINRNGLDNRKENLRSVTRSINGYNCKLYTNNSSGYRGVEWNKKEKKWHSLIRVDGKLIYCGSFLSLTAAAIAYNQAALKYRGGNAILNFIKETSCQIL
jgi:hypothetical protein